MIVVRDVPKEWLMQEYIHHYEFRNIKSTGSRMQTFPDSSIRISSSLVGGKGFDTLLS